MGTTIDQDLPPHHTVNGYLVPMEEEVATQEPVEDTEENNTDDVMKGKQSVGVMDVSIPISDRSYSTWKDKHLKEFTVYSHDDFLGVGGGQPAHYNACDAECRRSPQDPCCSGWYTHTHMFYLRCVVVYPSSAFFHPFHSWPRRRSRRRRWC